MKHCDTERVWPDMRPPVLMRGRRRRGKQFSYTPPVRIKVEKTSLLGMAFIIRTRDHHLR